MKLRKIEVLEKDPNKKGDLFGRLMGDLFHVLGYDEPRFTIHKSGREIDLNATHRTEQKIAIAECKAHAEPIGGADINKFVGTLDAEKRKIKKDTNIKGHNVVGYFISLSGFKETAIEQENEFGNKRVILIKADKISEELIKGRILVSIEQAISSLKTISSKLTLINYVDLIAYNRGWVWAIYFSDSKGQLPSHFTLIHAEGKPLIYSLVKEIILLDKDINKLFRGLNVIDSGEIINDNKNVLEETQKKYFKYLENELGEIHFEGLPTDKEAGSVKVKLENIFVPLHLSSIEKKIRNQFNNEGKNRKGIGEILSKNSRLAILAKPGGGKSTLIKRIAIAYAFPERRKQINDELPDKNWFPIFLRCRELGEKVTNSITDIINNIPSRAEIHSCSDEFAVLVSNSLQNGTALLLIDGLDEIAEDKSRIAFVNQLRTFIATYPTINIIVTSREAGFRVVGGSLATYCENYNVSNLIGPEIEELCLKWHTAIIDETENTIKEAKKLSDLILKDIRINVLAENPLLLTTLLFVKRWAGYLPTKRSVLYQEMIKLLLVTWNVEGHEILDIEEAEPQLAFVAYWMTKNGQQTISADELNNCLIAARKQMPEILDYTKISPSEFIKRVESRSSLLIMSGHKKIESGAIMAVYEFLHLSFQEYLTAKALVKKYLPFEDSKQKTIDLIKPNINNENWKEVIPLTAVLLERDTKELIEFLISESKIKTLKDINVGEKDAPASSLLGSCLANEIQINPDLLGIAIEWYAKKSNSSMDNNLTDTILKNKFGLIFRKKISECFFEKFDDEFSFQLGAILSEIFDIDLKNLDDESSILVEIYEAIDKGSREEKCMAILGLMGYAFRERTFRKKKKGTPASNEIQIEKIYIKLLELFTYNDKHLFFSISWSIGWAGDSSIFPARLKVRYTLILLNAYLKAEGYNMRRVISWALSKVLIPTFPKIEISNIDNLRMVINERFDKPSNEFDKLLAIYWGHIIGESFDETAIKEVFKRHFAGSPENENFSSFSLFAKALNIKIEPPVAEIRQ